MDEVDCGPGPLLGHLPQAYPVTWSLGQQQASPLRTSVVQDEGSRSFRAPQTSSVTAPLTCANWLTINVPELALLLKAGMEKHLLIDCRSFLEYNTSHIQQSANVCCSKLMKRRLQRDKVLIKDLLQQTCHIDIDEFGDVIVYDQCTENPANLTEDNFLCILLHKLAKTFKSVALVKGGFLAFQAMYPSLCESKTNNYRCAALTSLSQPCLPVSNVGPTRILPFLYLGSQQDALSQDTMQVNDISYILNVSTTCIKPPYISDGHFYRIPVNDNYSAKLQPYFNEAFQFLDKVREANGCVLVHCLAGISRSPTLAIAYIMKHLSMTSDDAYRYVKDKRPTISPNFNFLGQLLDFEKQLKREKENIHPPNGIPKQEPKGWSNYVMDLSSHSPSSPVSKNFKPFYFEGSQGTSTTQTSSVSEYSKEQKSTVSGSVAVETVTSDKESVIECPFPSGRESTVKHSFQSSKVMVQEVTSFHSPFPFSSESVVTRKITTNPLSLKTEMSRGSPFPYSSESAMSKTKSLTQIAETGELESLAVFPHERGTGVSTSTDSATVQGTIVQPPDSSISQSAGVGSCGSMEDSASKTLDVSVMETDGFPMPQNLDTGFPPSRSRTNNDSVTRMSTSPCQDSVFHVKKSRSHSYQSSSSSASAPEFRGRQLSEPPTPVTPSPGVAEPFSLSDIVLKSRVRRPLRTSLSLSLSPITPTKPSPSPSSSGEDQLFSFSSKNSSALPNSRRSCDDSLNIETKAVEASNIPAVAGKSSVTATHVVKLKSFSFSTAPTVTLSAQSPSTPTTSLAKLHFGTNLEREPDKDHQEPKNSVFKKEKTLPFNSFPTTSLDKLNFTPCLSKPTDETSPRAAGLKRPLNNNVLDLKTSEPTSPMSLSSTCSSNSYTSSSSVTSPSTSGAPKVIVRKREGRSKRPLVRPNSIAFSSYPTFDLGSDCQDSPNSCSSTASQDDTSESYMLQNGKKSKTSEYMADMKYRLGRYTGSEVYRQITAAMETAMKASRKSRSLDDILTSDEDSSNSNCECSTFDRVLRHCGLSRERYSAPALMFENLAACGCRDASDRYNSNSSLSSGGSHTSIHGSLEIIGVS